MSCVQEISAKLKCKCVIFDLDGTLIDAYQNIRDSANYTMSQLGYPALSLETVRRSVGGGPREFWRRFVRQEDLDRAEAIYRQRYEETLFEKTYLLPGVEQTLRLLKAEGIKMAVASNKPGRFSRPLLDYLRISEYFDLVVCGDEIENMKPHPEAILNIIRELKVLPDQTVYVGDMTLDIQTAKAAGVRGIAVVTGSSLKEELMAQKPFQVIESISELVRYINL